MATRGNNEAELSAWWEGVLVHPLPVCWQNPSRRPAQERSFEMVLMEWQV